MYVTFLYLQESLSNFVRKTDQISHTYKTTGKIMIPSPKPFVVYHNMPVCHTVNM